MTTPVVCDAGPLIALAKLNILYLLHELYIEVEIPPAVYYEAVTQAQEHGYDDARALRLYLEDRGWHLRDSVIVPHHIEVLHLDRGEKQCLALASDLSALLLIDEEAGRVEARRLGVQVRGTLGILIESHRLGILSTDQVVFYLQQIESRPDIWISPTLCKRVLREVLSLSR